MSGERRAGACSGAASAERGGRAGALPRSGRREEKGGRRGEKKRKKRRKRKEKRKKMRKGKEKEKERREKGKRREGEVCGDPAGGDSDAGRARAAVAAAGRCQA